MARSYRQDCALAIALDQVGERWTLLIVRELLIGERRFGELQHNLPGIGTNLLSDRLHRLVDLGLVDRIEGDSFPSYRLTDQGRGLEPALMALIRWGMAFDEPRRNAIHRRVEWALLPLKLGYQPDRYRDWAGSYAFELDGETTWIGCRNGELTLHDRPLEPVQATIRLDSVTAARLIDGRLAVEEALASGALALAGDPASAERFLGAFQF